MAGLQCHKQLWWRVHEPDAAELEIDRQLQAVFDVGHRVGALARAHVPGGVLIEGPHDAYEERLARTRDALAQGAAAVYEAAFRADNVFVSVDILERIGERTGREFCLTEVKSTTSVKEVHLTDVAVQAHVARRSGLAVARLEVMHLNRACAYPDLSNLFVRADVTEPVEARLRAIPQELDTLGAMLAGPRPSVAVGPHCSTPYECPFMERCWPPLPAHHVSTLYAMKQRALAALDEQGYRTIFDLPPDLALAVTADRQRRAVQAGRIIVEPGLAPALEACAGPMAFLDFETVGLAIPVWTGCHPYDAVPVQFSCHVEDAAGGVTHHAWLADGPGDPRPALAEHLVAACAGARTIAAYNARFERDCLHRLAESVPHLAAPLMRIDRGALDRSVADRAQPRLSPGLRRQLLAQERVARVGDRARLRRPRHQRGRDGQHGARSPAVSRGHDEARRAAAAPRGSRPLLRPGHPGDGETAPAAAWAGRVLKLKPAYFTRT